MIVTVINKSNVILKFYFDGSKITTNINFVYMIYVMWTFNVYGSFKKLINQKLLNNVILCNLHDLILFVL